jgi:NAD+ synthase
MNRITDYEELKGRIVDWIKDYYYMQSSLKSLVVGVSGGIDSAVVSTLCAETGLPTYVVAMPLESKMQNTRLSDLHTKQLAEKYENVTRVEVELSSVYDSFLKSVNWWSEAQHFDKKEFTSDELANANTKSRIRMVTLYQIAGAKKGIVIGTGNKVEDYGIGFYTKYGDGGVDIAPIADLYKTEVRELGGYLGVDALIIDAKPTDGLWDDGRSDEDQIGATYEELEEAMENGEGKGVDILYKFNNQNRHKMQPIPTFKL